MLYDYQREEFMVQAERAKHSLNSDCPLIEDEVTVAVHNHIHELEEFVRMITTDRFEWFDEKIEAQRDKYVLKAKWLLDRIDVPFEQSVDK